MLYNFNFNYKLFRQESNDDQVMEWEDLIESNDAQNNSIVDRVSKIFLDKPI